jgi:hypothetical protein
MSEITRIRKLPLVLAGKSRRDFPEGGCIGGLETRELDKQDVEMVFVYQRIFKYAKSIDS